MIKFALLTLLTVVSFLGFGYLFTLILASETLAALLTSLATVLVMGAGVLILNRFKK